MKNTKWNYCEGRFDMTQIPRLSENTGNPKLDALNKRVNAHSEKTEDHWIELDLALLDAMEAQKEKSKARRKAHRLSKPELFDECPEDIKADLCEQFDLE